MIMLFMQLTLCVVQLLLRCAYQKLACMFCEYIVVVQREKKVTNSRLVNMSIGQYMSLSSEEYRQMRSDMNDVANGWS